MQSPSAVVSALSLSGLFSFKIATFCTRGQITASALLAEPAVPYGAVHSDGKAKRACKNLEVGE